MECQKKQLPFGWMVKQSKSYPDRVYYFNINTGASTWEFPDLITPFVNGQVKCPTSPVALTAASLHTSATAGTTTAGTTNDFSGEVEAQFSPTYSDEDNDYGANKRVRLPASNSHLTPKAGHATIQTGHMTLQTGHMTSRKESLASKTSLNKSHTHTNSSMSIDKASRHNASKSQKTSETILSSSAETKSNQEVKKRKLHISPIKFDIKRNLTNSGTLIVKSPDTIPSGVGRNLSDSFESVSHSSKRIPLLVPSSEVEKRASQNLITENKLNKLPKVMGAAVENLKTIKTPVAGADIPKNALKDVLHSLNDLRHKIKRKIDDSADTTAKRVKLDNLKSPLAEKGQIQAVELDKKVANANVGVKRKNSDVYPRKAADETSTPVTGDKRKIVKSLHKTLNETRNVVVKDSALPNMKPSNKCERRSPEKDLKVVASVAPEQAEDTRQLPGRKCHLSIGSGSTDDAEDGNNNEKMKMFIGDKDKLLSIQSWINTLDENLGSDSPAREFYSIPLKTESPSVAEVTMAASFEKLLKALDSMSALDYNAVSLLETAMDKAKCPTRHVYTCKINKSSNKDVFMGMLMFSGVVIGRGEGPSKKICKANTYTATLQRLKTKPLQEMMVSVPNVSVSVEALIPESVDARVVVNDSLDSGYPSSGKMMSPQVRTGRGWPGELKPNSISSREIVEMEVDDCELPEYDVVACSEEDMDIDIVLSEVRKHVKSCPYVSVENLETGVVEHQTAVQSEQTIFIVLDTNVLIAKLGLLEDLKDYEVPGIGKPVLYIPWIVLQELDALKSSVRGGMPNLTLTTQNKARRAVRFLNSLLSIKHPRILGQTPKQAQQASLEFTSSCNDDAILQTCMQCQKTRTGCDVILLSNDNNLINKALVSGVQAYNSNDIKTGLHKIRQRVNSTPQKLATTDGYIGDIPHQSLLDNQIRNPSPQNSNLQHTPQISSRNANNNNNNNQIVSNNLATANGNNMATGYVDIQASPDNKIYIPATTLTYIQETANSTVGATPNSNSLATPDNRFTANSQAADSSVDNRVTNNPTSEKRNSLSLPRSNQNKCMAEGLLQEEKLYTVEALVDDLYCKMKTVLSEALGKVLETEMQLAYDDIWMAIVYKKPPWSFMDILECWKKHWMAVFGMIFQRHLSQNVDRLIRNLSSTKGYTLEIMMEASQDSLELLQECVKRNLYGSTMIGIKECVHCMKELCDSIITGHMTIQSISSLDHYLKSKLLPPEKMTYGTSSSNVPGKSTTQSIPSPGQSSSCPSVNRTVVQSNSHTTINQSISQTESQIKTCLQSPENQTVSQTLNSSTYSVPIDSVQSDGKQEVTGSSVTLPHTMQHNQPVSNDSVTVSQEEVAGEVLQHIWQFIYKYCDHIYKALTSRVSADVMKEIEILLNMLVPAAKELRIHYASILEMPVSELIHHEDMFNILCNHCNTFFNRLNVKQDTTQVTPNQLLMLYSNAQHRETLNQFLTQMDDMLRHLYQCIHTMYPD